MGRYRGLVESKARAYFVLGADHDDVVQEGMIGLFKAIRDFREDRLNRFRPFAELCVTRQIITAVKTATRHKHGPLNASVSLNQRLSGDEAHEQTLLDVLPDRGALAAVDERLFAKPLAGDLQEIEEALSELEKNVLAQYLEGRTYSEMSATLHCHTKSIDNALQRAKRKIGQLMRQ